MKTYSIVLLALLLVACREESEAPDPRDVFVGTYEGILMPVDATLQPIQVLDYVIISPVLEKSAEPDAFLLRFGSQALKCVGLQTLERGFSFKIPEQSFHGFGPDGLYTGYREIEMDGAKHEGLIVVESSMITFLARNQTFSNKPVYSFTGTKKQ